MVFSLEEVGVLGNLEPLGHIDGTLGPEAYGIEFFVSEIVDTVLVVVAAAYAEAGLLA